MDFNFLKKIAAAMGDEDDSAGADQQRDQIEEESEKKEKDKKKKKKPEEKSEKKPAGNGQAGPVLTDGSQEEPSPASAEAIPAEDGSAPVSAEGEETIPPQGEVSTTPAQVGVSEIIDFLQANPHPDDSAIHAFAEQAGMPPEQLETMIYGLTSKFVNFMRGGKMSESGLDISSVDPQQLEMGIQVEMEHTPDFAIAKKIALDHLAEIPDYYTRLATMEDQAKSEVDAAAVPIKQQNGASEETENKDGEETKENDPNIPVGANNRAEL